MKNRLLQKNEEQDVFTDLLFNALLGFAFMFAIAFMLINSSDDSGKIESKAEVMISVSWPDSHPDDVDAIVEDPQGGLVWYHNRDSGLMHLDRDDRGLFADKMNVNGAAISNPINQGYGGNQKIGFLYAIKNNFDYVALVHGDGQYAPEYLEKLVGPLVNTDIDAVFGSRIKHNEDYFYYKLNRIAVIILSNLINFLYKSSFTDTATNHKLVKREVLNNLNLVSKGFNLDFEIALKLAKYKYRSGEIAIKFNPRSYKEGKKINFIDAFKSFFVILYFYFF